MPNRLSTEKSPYLLQHAENPVDWHPWGEAAFTQSREENKPIFLSIGYSTCHWCHVMERESFENAETAALLNASFVSIKVDREERPDIDRVYMAAVQTMTGSGGWPMSVFLTPDLKPFYGGTYFPPADMHGRPGFPTVLARIRQFWDEERDTLEESGERLLAVLREQNDEPADRLDPQESMLHAAYETILASYDAGNAGFGRGPKFPRPAVFAFLFRYYTRTGNPEALRIALTTLMAMASGGMYDHLGGGFHRYSVDAEWRVPHFEKMLYDQAQLLGAYTDAFEITRDEFFAVVARETADYVLREMTDARGGFYSAEDADSPEPGGQPQAPAGGHDSREGAFYVWTHREIGELLTEDEARVFRYHYSVEEEGNVRSDPHGEFSGKNILFAPHTTDAVAARCEVSALDAAALLASAKEKLLASRAARPRPLLDDKIITAWNGMMIASLARASVVLGEDRYRNAALHAAEFLAATLYDTGLKTLARRYRDGEASNEAHLDDYACAVHGMLELHAATSDARWLEIALTLTGTQEALFWDAASGGFYETSGKDASVLVRMKEMYDGAEPAGNSVAAMNLVRLARMTGTVRHQTMARSTLRALCSKVRHVPHLMPLLMAAADAWLSPPATACTEIACGISPAAP